MEQNYSYKTLEKNYESIIKDYLPKVNDTVRKQLIYNNEIRFWNCVDVESAKERILWMSINPSGKPEEEMPKFNKTWEEVRNDLTGNKKVDRYWLRMLDNIRHIKCGHMDLLPIHWASEKEMKDFIFPREDCMERKLAYDLIQESKKMIEALHPKLIIYSNATTEWLWGNGNPNFWLGYDPQPEKEMTGEYWRSLGVEHGRLLTNKTSLYTIKLGDRKTYLLIDYQVANSRGYDALTGDDVKKICIELFIELGNDACDRREYDKAIEAYSIVIETDEHLIDGYLCRAFAHEKLGNWQSAVDDYTSGIAQCDDDSTLLWLFYRKRAYVYAKMNHYEAAAEDYTKAIESFIENPEIVSIVKWDEEGLTVSTDHELTDEEISTIRMLYQERSEVYRKLGRIDLAKADEEEMLRLNNG